jgi:hypothetical protein
MLECGVFRVYVLGSRGEEKWWWVNGRRSVQEPTVDFLL